MSNHRKNSVRDKVKDKKWIYLERYSIERMWSIAKGEHGPGRHIIQQSVGHLGRQEAWKYGVVRFHGLGNLMG